MLIEQTLVLSTSHLIDLDIDPLDGDFGSHRAVEHEFGYILFVAVEDSEEERKLMLLETPEWLHPILKLAWEQKCSYINFDRDVTPIKELPIYDGEEVIDTEELLDGNTET